MILIVDENGTEIPTSCLEVAALNLQHRGNNVWRLGGFVSEAKIPTVTKWLTATRYRTASRDKVVTKELTRARTVTRRPYVTVTLDHPTLTVPGHITVTMATLTEGYVVVTDWTTNYLTIASECVSRATATVEKTVTKNKTVSKCVTREVVTATDMVTGYVTSARTVTKKVYCCDPGLIDNGIGCKEDWECDLTYSVPCYPNIYSGEDCHFFTGDCFYNVLGCYASLCTYTYSDNDCVYVG